MNDVTRMSKAVAAILTHAEAHDLPIPSEVVITYAEVKVMVVTLDALTQWALYLDQCVEVQRYSADHRLALHQVRGAALEQPIKVWTLTDWKVAEDSLEAAFERLAEGVSA
jgi:hypothetical protein